MVIVWRQQWKRRRHSNERARTQRGNQNLNEAARFMGVARSTARRYIRGGLKAYLMPNGTYEIAAADLLNYVMADPKRKLKAQLAARGVKGKAARARMPDANASERTTEQREAETQPVTTSHAAHISPTTNVLSNTVSSSDNESETR